MLKDKSQNMKTELAQEGLMESILQTSRLNPEGAKTWHTIAEP
jgi:hypothetical protein